MEGPAGISPEKVLGSQFATMYTEVAYQAAAFAGLDATANHLQASPDANTSSVVVAGVEGKRVLVLEVAAMTTGGNLDYTGTLGEEGSDDDLFVYTGTQYSEARLTAKILLGENKDLIHYRVAGNVGSSTSDANIINVAYTMVDV